MYRVRLQDFEGPLDLLLFFIRRDELDVFNIPIAEIADEYLEYVRILEEIDLDSVGDFLYMAALLINVKARMLLPTEEVDEEGEPIDPRRELVERLLEYVRFKEASEELAGLEEERRDRFTRGHASAVAVDGDAGTDAVVDATVFDLISALRRVLTEEVVEPTHGVAREDYTLDEQADFLRALLEKEDRLSFVDVARGRSKPFIITTFLAVLEMARQGEIELMLPSHPSDFYIRIRLPEAEGAAVNGVSSNGKEPTT